MNNGASPAGVSPMNIAGRAAGPHNNAEVSAARLAAVLSKQIIFDALQYNAVH